MPVDVVLMDPPRAGSSEEFLDAVAKIGPKRVVYVSCNPTTLERDCSYLEKQGYRAKEVWPVDMFPWSGAVEAVCLLEKTKSEDTWMTIEERANQAAEWKAAGIYNCAQAVTQAFADQIPVEAETLKNLARVMRLAWAVWRLLAAR